MINTSKILLHLIRVLPSVPLKGYDVILCYHSIDDSNDTFSVSQRLFKSHIKQLKKNFNLVSFDKLINEKNNGKEIRVAISFDDGYKSVLLNAYKILEECGITAAVFVIGNSKKHTENAKPHLTHTDCKVLLKKRWIIGWHTNNHMDLLSKSDSIVSRDFNSLRRTFEKRIRKKLHYVAYPFGRYSSKTEKIAFNSGFENGFSVNGGRANTNRFTIDRVTVTSFMTSEDVVRLIKPFGLFTNKLFTFVWKLSDNRI